MAAKRFLQRVTSRLRRHPVDQKFRRNRSISLRYQDKCVFAFNAEIQDGRQKWWENDFLRKVTSSFVHTLRVKNFAEIALSHSFSRDKRVFPFNAEIQDGR